MLTLMREEGLAKVMAGADTSAGKLGEYATDTQRHQHAKALGEYCEKNGKSLTRSLLATSDHADGDSGAGLVIAFAPNDDFGDGRGAVIALNIKYRRHSEARMQKLHDAISALKVASVDGFDPDRIITQVRRMLVELQPLGDDVISGRKKHAPLKSLRDTEYDALRPPWCATKTKTRPSQMILW